MRTASRWVVVAVVALCVAGVASAQQQRQRQGGGRGMMFGGGGLATLLGNESVQKELKFTDDQKTKAKEFSDEQRAKMREAFGGGQPDREKMQELMKESNEKAEKFVKDNLKPDQQKRITQIHYQTMGLAAFANEDVQKALNLTGEQKEKVKTLADDLRKDMQELRQGGFNQEMFQKMRTINKEYMTKAVDSLTADQKAKWKELTGEPF